MFADVLDEAKTRIMRGELDPAIQGLSEFLNHDFYHAEALFMLGGALMSKGMNGLGAVLTSAAIDARAARNGKFPEAMLNLGAAYKLEGDRDTAEKIWLDALRQETLPRERAKIMTNIAGLYLVRGHGAPERAVDWCDRALQEDPKCFAAMANRGLGSLEMCRWQEGWAGWLQTYAAGDRNRRAYGDIPVWDGTPGKHVVCWGDQGVGDEIFYAECLRDLERICRKVTLDCHPRLPALFARSFPEMTVHGTRKDLSELDWLSKCDADAAVALADLPAFFRNDGEWTGQPYLKAAPDWPLVRNLIETRPEYVSRRIGLSWTGGSKQTYQTLRSINIDKLEPILRARPDAQWFSLQYTPDAARQVCELEERTGIRISHYPGWVECYDYDRTASFVGSLDLVITVGTTIHHLAGALGVPTWTLVPVRASWRYAVGFKTDRVPWYGSARLYRQERDGDWSAPIERVAADLAEI